MRVGWLCDEGNADGSKGGAELTMDEFARAAPDGTLIADCGGDKLFPEEVDVWVLGNCVSLGPELIDRLRGKPVVKVTHDMWPHGDPTLKRWLLDHATLTFCSPLHRERFPHPYAGPWKIIPPALDLDRFRKAKNGDRRDACHVGHFMYGGKGGALLNEWAEQQETKLNVYGTGPHMPDETEWVIHRGPLNYDEVPEVLAKHARFVHLPTKVEPFGRSVVEAWAAGCEVITNRNVGARYFIEEAPARLETAGCDFWSLVMGAA